MKRELTMQAVNIFARADSDKQALLLDMLFCFANCGEDFVQEMEAVQGDKAAIITVIQKWITKATAAEKNNS